MLLIDNYKTFRKHELTISFYDKNLFMENSVIAGTNSIEESFILKDAALYFNNTRSFEFFY